MTMAAIDSSTNNLITITYDGGRMILDPIAFVVNHPIKDTRDLCRWVLKIAHDREEVVNEILRRLEKAKEDRPELFDDLSSGALVSRYRRLERAKYYIGRLVES